MAKENEGKLLSSVKLDIYWITFQDRHGRERNRMIFKNPKDRFIMWDMGVDREPTIPIDTAPFEDEERLRIEKLDNMTLARCPDWLTNQIKDKIKDTDHYFDEEGTSDKPAPAEAIKKKAEQIAGLDHPSGALGGVSGS